MFDLPLKYVSNARNAHTLTQQQHLGVINAIALRLKVCTAKSADRMRCPPFTPHPRYSSSDNKLRARKPTEGNFYSFSPLLLPPSRRLAKLLTVYLRIIDSALATLAKAKQSTTKPYPIRTQRCLIAYAFLYGV